MYALFLRALITLYNNSADHVKRDSWLFSAEARASNHANSEGICELSSLLGEESSGFANYPAVVGSFGLMGGGGVVEPEDGAAEGVWDDGAVAT